MRRLFVPSILLVAVLIVAHGVQAQVMQSSNYQLQSDSVNIGGGLSSSTNYVQESTVGEVGTGPSDSSSYSLRAGYQQMQEVYLALSGGENVTMTPSIPGVSGGIANGSTTLTAVTDSPSGYKLTVESSASPSMTSGANSIADYAPQADPDPDVSFTTNSTDAHFGFSPFGDHVVERFQTNGSSCNVSGSASTTACWDGLSTTAVTIAQSTSANQPDGTDTTIYFRVGVGSSVLQPDGSYIATTTVTLLPL